MPSDAKTTTWYFRCGRPPDFGKTRLKFVAGGCAILSLDVPGTY